MQAWKQLVGLCQGNFLVPPKGPQWGVESPSLLAGDQCPWSCGSFSLLPVGWVCSVSGGQTALLCRVERMLFPLQGQPITFLGSSGVGSLWGIESAYPTGCTSSVSKPLHFTPLSPLMAGITGSNFIWGLHDIWPSNWCWPCQESSIRWNSPLEGCILDINWALDLLEMPC